MDGGITSLSVYLTEGELTALLRMAKRELRAPAQQLRFLLRKAIEQERSSSEGLEGNAGEPRSQAGLSGEANGDPAA